MADAVVKQIVKRHQRVAFMNTGTSDAPVFTRMKNFTDMTNSKNPKEYSRQYVDEEFEESDVVGYAPSIAYSFDRHTNSAVHEKIAKIHDGELTGSETIVDILIVDLFTKAEDTGECEARRRSYAVIPSDDGRGTDALIYTGTFKAKTTKEECKATVSDDGLTATYIAAKS